MAIHPADLSHALVADLPRGRLEGRAPGSRLVALPVEWLGGLIETLQGPIEPHADALASALAADALAMLEGETSPEEVAHALCAAFATRGLGRVRFERWGDALVLVWCDPPWRGPVAAVLEARIAARLVSAVSGSEVDGVVVSERERETAILLAHPEVCAMVRGLEPGQAALPGILDRLSSSEAP